MFSNVVTIFPSEKEIIGCILNGIMTARYNFANWTSNELYLSYAPVKFLEIHVSQEIAKLKNKPEIFIDATIADILRCSLPKRDAFHQFMHERCLSQGLISVTLDERLFHRSENSSISRVVITLKNGVHHIEDEYIEDIENICKLLNHDKREDTSLDYGVFAFYLDISNTARKKASERISSIIKAFDEIVLKYSNLSSNLIDGNIRQIENIGEWAVGCYVIEPIWTKDSN